MIYSDAVWPNLMGEAGIADRSGFTGGDWGSAITTVLGALHSDHCKAIHVNLCFAPPNWLNPWHMAQVRTVTHYLLQESSITWLPEVSWPEQAHAGMVISSLPSVLCIRTCVDYSTGAGCWCMFENCLVISAKSQLCRTCCRGYLLLGPEGLVLGADSVRDNVPHQLIWTLHRC